MLYIYTCEVCYADETDIDHRRIRRRTGKRIRASKEPERFPYRRGIPRKPRYQKGFGQASGWIKAPITDGLSGMFKDSGIPYKELLDDAKQEKFL
jgi:hypothetical protein